MGMSGMQRGDTEHGDMDRGAYTHFVEVLCRRLERRRRMFLLWWGVQASLAVALMIAGCGFPHASLQFLASILPHSPEVSGLEIASFTFFCVLMSNVLVAVPVVRYRGGLGRGSTLHRRVWVALCMQMPGAEVASPAASLLQELRASAIFPADAGIAEQPALRLSAKGHSALMVGVRVASGEASVGQPLFRGIVVQRSAARTFREFPVSAAQRPRLLIVPEAFASLSRLREEGWPEPLRPYLLPSSFSGYCAFAAGDREGGWDDRLADLEEARCLALRAAALPSFRLRAVTRLAHVVQEVMFGVADMLRRSRENTPIEAERLYDRQFVAAPSQLVHGHTNSVYDGVLGALLTAEKTLVVLPCAVPLLLPESLWGASLTKDAALWLYDVLQWMERPNQESGRKVPNFH